MRLSRFINEHIEEILAEWESFAKTLEPAAEGMSGLALRDHAKQILQSIAIDIESWQNSEKQYEKSQGLAPDIEEKPSAASIHGAMRQASNFSLLQLSAEYRALRATVLRLWLPQLSEMSATTTYEMIRLNEAIDQALAESVVTYSARAEQTRDLFLAILGHDLRAPLSSVTLACDLLAHPKLEQNQIAQIGTRIRRNTRMMSGLVNDLLGYTRMQLGSGMPMTLESADLKEICQSAIEDANATHPGSIFELRTTGDLHGSFDSARLNQLFTNLLVNAAQYGIKESPIIIEASGASDAITVRVTNHGPAIPEASLQSIFKPLIQLSIEEEADNRSRTSLGLGLFVAREIAVAHGGTISVASSDADGTVFTVLLPQVVHAPRSEHVLGRVSKNQ
ncbi:MAG: sensor histidine kinase [Burkholderiaceae bacterium]